MNHYFDQILFQILYFSANDTLKLQISISRTTFHCQKTKRFFNTFAKIILSYYYIYSLTQVSIRTSHKYSTLKINIIYYKPIVLPGYIISTLPNEIYKLN